MPRISRGFRGRRPDVDPSRLPPGQRLTRDFPVPSYGPTPHTPLDRWSFTIDGAVDAAASWDWEQLRALPAETEYATAWSDGGYTTNVPLADLTDGRAWIAYGFGGEPLEPEHGGPARLLVPHLYFWKSAKWVRGLSLTLEDEPGFWEVNGYHDYGDPWREQRYQGD
jgi:DMSO/TMAO reductase YedYZ molybdopterin-dependent catalytic subunit